jgi:hypothetical protein
MIHHFSISAQNPRHVTEVLASVIGGFVVPFPPHPGSFMAFAGDEYGTAIEVYPLGIELAPGQEEQDANFVNNASPSQLSATHAAISVKASQEQIEEIGKREGWRVRRFSREGLFDVIEFWIENRVLVEFLTPEMASQYLALAKPEALEALMAQSTPV